MRRTTLAHDGVSLTDHSYVAMHTMQEGQHSHETTNGALENGYAESYAQQSPKNEGLNLSDILMTVAGMLLPMLTQIGHAH